MPKNNGLQRRNKRRTTAISCFEEAVERRNKEIKTADKDVEAVKKLHSKITNLKLHIEKTKAKLRSI